MSCQLTFLDEKCPLVADIHTFKKHVHGFWLEDGTEVRFAFEAPPSDSFKECIAIELEHGGIPPADLSRKKAVFYHYTEPINAALCVSSSNKGGGNGASKVVRVEKCHDELEIHHPTLQRETLRSGLEVEYWTCEGTKMTLKDVDPSDLICDGNMHVVRGLVYAAKTR
jgi:hypothetical protein